MGQFVGQLLALRSHLLFSKGWLHPHQLDLPHKRELTRRSHPGRIGTRHREKILPLTVGHRLQPQRYDVLHITLANGEVGGIYSYALSSAALQRLLAKELLGVLQRIGGIALVGKSDAALVGVCIVLFGLRLRLQRLQRWAPRPQQEEKEEEWNLFHEVYHYVVYLLWVKG